MVDVGIRRVLRNGFEHPGSIVAKPDPLHGRLRTAIPTYYDLEIPPVGFLSRAVVV
jgi:hypothetical protein